MKKKKILYIYIGVLVALSVVFWILTGWALHWQWFEYFYLHTFMLISYVFLLFIPFLILFYKLINKKE